MKGRWISSSDIHGTFEKTKEREDSYTIYVPRAPSMVCGKKFPELRSQDALELAEDVCTVK